jgi:hypothetical protein
MRTNYITALLATLALAAPLWASQRGGGEGASHRESSPAPRMASPATRPPGMPSAATARMQQRPQARQFTAQGAPPVIRNGPSARPQVRSTAPPVTGVPRPSATAVPHQVIRGQGPHNGDWLRDTMRLSPQEQQRKLEQDQHYRQLPAQRQEQLKNRLQKFNSMPPQQQQRVLNRMEMIEHLKPEQQKQAQALFGQFSSMNPDRKDLIRRTLHQMRGMPPEARDRMLNSPATQSRYSPQEIQMLRGFNDIGFASPEQP